MLHWVGDDSLTPKQTPFCVSILQFEKFAQWLCNKNVIHLEDWESENDFCALTFDDVPESFYNNAYPILRKYSIPFTLFVNISLLDKTGYISRAQLIEISRCDLCTIGSHGVEHGETAMLTKQQFLNDLSQSKEELEAIIGGTVKLYAYPYGSYYACGYKNKHLSQRVYSYAFSTVNCPITRPMFLGKYFLPRINVDNDFINAL